MGFTRDTRKSLSRVHLAPGAEECRSTVDPVQEWGAPPVRLAHWPETSNGTGTDCRWGGAQAVQVAPRTAGCQHTTPPRSPRNHGNDKSRSQEAPALPE